MMSKSDVFVIIEAGKVTKLHSNIMRCSGNTGFARDGIFFAILINDLGEATLFVRLGFFDHQAA